MNDSIIARRYAKAFFKLGKERDTLGNYRNDLQKLYSFILQDENFRFLLNNPVVTATKKQKIFDKLFKNYLSSEVLFFIKLLIKKRREVYMPDIIRAFNHFYLQHANIQQVKISSATKFDKETIDQIKSLLEQATGKSSEIETIKNTDLIGGFIIRIDDRQLDASVKGQLQSIRKQLLS